MSKEEQLKCYNSGSTTNLGANIKLIKHYIEKGTLTNEMLLERLENMSKSVNKIDEIVDTVYNHFKKEHENSQLQRPIAGM